jgi:hypothetical protein
VPWLVTALALLGALILSGSLRAQEYEAERSYGTVRVLSGEASLQSESSADRIELEPNYPIVTGDRLWVPPGSKAHLALPDGSQLSVGGGTELVFDQLALSLDSDDTTTRIRLLQGRIDVLVDEYFLAEELPIIDTANARLFVQSEPARLAVGANHSDWTEVTTRDGLVEVLTPSGSSLVRADEELTVRGIHETSIDLARAAPLQDLELWADDAVAQLGRESYEELDQPLTETTRLTEHGDWVEIDGDRAWRPRVEVSWRPYSAGRWVSTPTGLYWAAYDPWSPVTYHYGGWDNHPRWGWVWYPGYRYAPAHVAWYFGPDYYGWIPTTYYRRHYGFDRIGFGFRFGVWGYAGGYWDPFYDWTFCPTGYFGARRGYRHYRSGRDYRDHGRLSQGYVTTDTTYISKDHVRHPERIYRDLDRERGRGAELVDVTPLLARGKEIPESVRKAVLVRGESEVASAKARRGVLTNGNVSGSKETGVRRAAAVSGTAKPAVSTRGSVAATARDRNDRAPAKAIVDGVRQRSDPGSATKSATTWRTTDRERGKVPTTVSRPSTSGKATGSVRPSAPATSSRGDRGTKATPSTRSTPRASAKPSSPPPRTSAKPSSPPPRANPRGSTSQAKPRSTPPQSRPKATPPPAVNRSGASAVRTAPRSNSGSVKSTPVVRSQPRSTTSRSPSAKAPSRTATPSRSTRPAASSRATSSPRARTPSTTRSTTKSSSPPSRTVQPRSTPSRSSRPAATPSRSTSSKSTARSSSKASRSSSSSKPRKPPQE